MAMADAHIVLENLRKSFGPKQVLNGVTLSVPKGHSLVVIGGSGTGKSVMLKCILGILQPDSGTIRIAGENVVGLKGKERDIYLGSADLMERNLDWRVEVAFPILNEKHQDYIWDLMQLQIADTSKARVLDETQSNVYVAHDGNESRSQWTTRAYIAGMLGG